VGEAVIKMECRTLVTCPQLLAFVQENEENLFEIEPCVGGNQLEDDKYLCPVEEDAPIFENQLPCDCIRIMECEPLVKLVQEDKWGELAKLGFCGFDGLSPKYCC
jgi:hypothetical protein